MSRTALVLLLVAGCGGAGRELDAAEAVFRHQLGAAAPAGRPGRVHCLGFGPEPLALRDPSPELVARLGTGGRRVVPASACGFDRVRAFDRASGGDAVFLHVHDLRCGPLSCDAKGGELSGNLGGSGERYRVENRKDGWVVTRAETDWTS